jgi:hypothetical protein
MRAALPPHQASLEINSGSVFMHAFRSCASNPRARTSGVLGLFLAASAMLGAANFANAASFTPGNLVVVRIGDGTAPLTPNATAVFLDEYTPAGVLVQSIALPTSVVGANFRLTNSGTATSEGFLNLSSNGLYLLHGGYDAAVGTAAIAGTTSTAVARVVARVDLNGNIDTTTALGRRVLGRQHPQRDQRRRQQHLDRRTASGATGGARYATLGSLTSTQLNATLTNTRVIGIEAGQLYVSSSSGAYLGVSTVGTGLPNSSGQTITLLNGFPTTAGPSTYDYFFASASTLYVADDRSIMSGGGIQKWTESGGTWTLQYTLAGTTGCRGLTGYVTGGVATLFATTTQTSANTIVTVTDTGAGSAVTTVATAGANTAVRGVRYLASGVVPSVNYCTAGTTTNGCVATMSSTGTPSVSASSGFTLDVTNVEGQKTGIIFYGASGPVATPWARPRAICASKRRRNAPRRRTPAAPSSRATER